MSSASARAQARRQAILSRGSDRLAKLTTSGRGEDAPAYMHDDPPVPKLSSLSNFAEEGTSIPTPPSRGDTVPTGAPDPSVWSEQQQQQLMQALMGRLPAGAETSPMPNLEDNPFLSNLLAASGGGNGKGGLAGGMPAMGKVPEPVVQPKSLLQKLLPLLHLVIMWGFLAFFVLYKEPQVQEALGGLTNDPRNALWQRWAELGSEKGRIQLVPFFWALTTIQIVLHSTRIFVGTDAAPLPFLLNMAVPLLPPQLSSTIVYGWKYISLFSMLLDDLAGLIVGLGFIVWLASWFAA
ncbi:uncharacterized protein EV420DRAFT_1520601 [Desarmillaria tabescens]|uniref:Uncharacterized protein n=1 Tax=Armillaria tabescens TaxID=1929756 RepID=A0AA39NDZ0_ARMTA|nr:uncharacterized protein EV420DRAFT_1520601 [Desarmillaria tabescens]KAK0463891.1 hypothetical protein EV420DRAFT_1520601 [Desarmillaria tabescens]